MNLADYLRAIQAAQVELAETTVAAQNRYSQRMQAAQDAFIGDVTFAPFPPGEPLPPNHPYPNGIENPVQETVQMPLTMAPQMPQTESGDRGFMD